MNPRLILFVCTALLALPTVASLAQRRADVEPHNRPDIIRRLEAEIGGAAFEYWTPRLNDYKNRIDQSLTGDDLAELNRLRVRWAILLDQGLRSTVRLRSGDTASARFDAEAMGRLQEVMTIYMSARGLAARYRPDMDRLSSDVIDDVVAFAGDMAQSAERFVDANRSAFEADPQAEAMLARRGDLRAAVDKLRGDHGRKGLESIYALAIEPIVLLYDGTDLKTLLTGAIPSGVTVGGMELPDASALRQNIPNPASTSTVIRYTLATESSATTLQIFDGRGDLVAIHDQGPRSAGDHEIAVDVSSLPSGSYVYRLMTVTGKETRSQSRVMQVAR